MNKLFKEFITAGIAPSTQKTYTSAYRRFTSFCVTYNIENPFLESEALLCYLAAFLAHDGLAPNSIKLYLTAVWYFQVSMPFVTVNTAGQHKSPSSLFDPESELLMKLYREDPVFPSGEFIQYTNELRLCGLRGPNSIIASDVYKVVCNIKTNSNNVSIAQCDDITFVKAVGVLNFLEAYPHLLDEIVVVERGDCLVNEKPLKAAIAELVETYPLFTNSKHSTYRLSTLFEMERLHISQVSYYFST